MRKEQRLRKQIAELQNQWELLDEKLQRLGQDKILKTDASERFRLDHEIADAKAEREQLEQQLNDLEQQLARLPSPMSEFAANLSGKQRFLAFALTLFLFEILLASWTGGTIATIMLTILIPAILWFSQKIWLSEGYGKASIRRVCSGIVILIAASFSLWNPLVGSFLLNPVFQALKSRVSGLERYQFPLGMPSMEILFVVLTGFFLVNYFFMRDTSAMKAHSTPIEKEFPEKGYKQRLKSFCGVLLDDLNKIDRETNWSAEYFTPLDAEVEMQSGNKRLKKVTDLLSAIRSDRKSRVFLVLGDPGSGKSVALRKLCRDLLQEVDKTGKVPLYINLREWEVEEEWTEENPPTIQQLYNFVLKNLKERGDVFANEFVERYFKPMFDYGRFFIVLDSFDEIPAVLDADASSWLIDKLSDVIYKFLAGAHESRGILASRIFRKPTHNFQTKTTLEIRPFTEVKITKTFQKSMLQDSEKLTKLLFKEREEFVPIARNPFTAALIVSYAKEHNNTLPQTQAELYSDYINRRLLMCQDRIKKRNLTAEGVIQRAEDIADLMFITPEFGLEVPLEELKTRFSQYFVEDEIAILKYGRLGRSGGGEEHRFSFAHRRFQEYFVAKRLLEKPGDLSLEAIPTDSRWRDALVLYCEVAADREAREIAEFCWSEISKITDENLNMSDPQYFRAIHSLRFLKDAFRSRLDYLSSFRDKLADFIDRQIESKNLLAVKLAVEAAGLLEEARINSIIVKALNIGSAWIGDIALKACRHLPNLSLELEKNFKKYINTISVSEIFRRRKEFLFSLSLSDGFISLYEFCKARIVNTYFQVAGILWTVLLLSVIHPIIIMPMVLIAVEVFLLKKLSTPESDLNLKVREFIRRHLWKEYKRKQPSVVRAIYILTFVFSFIPLYFLVIIIMTNFMQMGYFVQFSNGLFSITIPKTVIYNLIDNYFECEPLFWTSFLILLSSCLIVLFLVPWYQIRLYGRNFFLKRLIKSILSIIALWIVVYDVFFKGVSRLLTPTLSIILFILGSGLLFILIFIGSRPLFRDYKHLKELSNISKLKRRDLSQQFNKLKTPWGRLKYVQRLQNENIRVEGDWPGGKIPNVNNDEASTLLAQLEERWLGLDR